MPAKKQWKIPIQLSNKYSERELKAIGMDVIDRIVTRSQNENVDKNGNKFPAYSETYSKSLDFKNAGKSGDVDLTLSGDMLASLKILEIKKGKVVVGFEKGIENDKAEGNILGTYGTDKPNKKKARDFLGITDKEKEKILSNYPTNDARVRDKSVGQQEFAKELVDFVFGGES